MSIADHDPRRVRLLGFERRRRQLAIALVAVVFASRGAGSGQDLPADLTAVSLQDLTRIRITSVAKKQQSLDRAAAAVFVVTADDIRRMGATSVPEALRFVPGVQVARIDANKWAVSARGFNGRFSNKLLVLIDGRSIYSPLFSVVLWEMHDLPMDDVERIEVIRGPGATMWGANAVNGVINIITKPASATQGGSASVQAGSLDGPLSTIRYGGRAGKGSYRVFTKTQERLSSPNDSLEAPVRDGWRSMRAGLRYEAPLGDQDQIEVHAGAHSLDGSQRSLAPRLTPPFNRISVTDQAASTGFVLGRWRHSFSDRSEVSLQAYYDQMEKREEGVYTVGTKTGDLELQHRLQQSERLELNWGFGYRAVADEMIDSRLLTVETPKRRYQYLNAFAQEEIQLIPDSLFLTAGAKFEQNTFGGFVAEPTIRMLWAPTRSSSLWGAVSRAARAPSRAEHDVRFDVAALELLPGMASLVSLFPNPEFGYETMTAYEAGFRTNWGERWTLDLALFENFYNDAARVSALEPQLRREPVRHLLIPIQFDNSGRSRSRGAEASAKWRPTKGWDLAGTATWLDSGQETTGSAFTLAGAPNPSKQFSAQSHLRVRRNVEVSVFAAYTDSIPAAGLLNRGQRLPSYVRGDARIEWRRRNGMRLSFGVQDAINPSRYEFHPESLTVASPVGRNVYGRVSWGF